MSVLVWDDLIRAHSKDKHVVSPYLIEHLDIGTIHSSDSERSIEHKLHVSCSGCLLACCGNLLADICCRKNNLGIGYLVILDKYYLELAANRSIVIYHISHTVDELYCFLCISVACCCLCSKNECSRIEIHRRIFLNLVVQIHHMKDVHELSLVLVKSLNLHIKDRIRIYVNSVVLLDILC